MKKFSILLGMLLYAFAWMINSVSASPFEITFPDSSKYGYNLLCEPGSSCSIFEDEGNPSYPAGFSFTNASAGDYTIKVTSGIDEPCFAAVTKNQENPDIVNNEKTFTLQPGDTLFIHFDFNYGEDTKDMTITVPVPTDTPTPTPTPTFAPSSTPMLTFTPTFAPSSTPMLTFTPTFAPSLIPILTFTPTFAPSLIPILTFTPTSTSEIPVIIEATAEPTEYIYPEDETGQYYLNADGYKIYCSFNSYEICLYYMGNPELCEQYRR